MKQFIRKLKVGDSLIVEGTGQFAVEYKIKQIIQLENEYKITIEPYGVREHKKELDNEEIDFINGEHLEQGWDYE